MNRRLPRLTTVLATLASAGLLVACSDDTGAGAGAEPTTDATSESPPPSETAAQDWTRLSEVEKEAIAPGRYGLTVAEDVLPDLPVAVIDVPVGCSHFAGWIVTCADRDDQAHGGVGYWTLHAVYEDPCTSSAVAVATVEDAAAAFRAQRRSEVTKPRPVSLGGYDGLYLELVVPEDTDFAACPQYHPWDIDPAGGLPYLQKPGRERLWLLEVDGDTVVLDVSEDKGVSAPTRAQLTSMVEGLEFVPSTA